MLKLARTLVCLLAALPLAADGTAMLKDAIAYYYGNGAVALIKEANTGKFHISPAGYLIVLDETGKTLIHGESSRLIGVNMTNLKDARGRLYIKEALDARAKGKGKVHFYMPQGNGQVKATLQWEFQEGVLFGWVMAGEL
ncbi:MAG TPA: cache domain-containing protein [Geothrix sp.]|nr:cache domain-containing protein [Geothrix sp.]